MREPGQADRRSILPRKRGRRGGLRPAALEALEPRLLLSTWHVSSIVDPAEDGSAEHPFDSIQEAIDQAASGDTIEVQPGTYVEDLLIETDNLDIVGVDGADLTTIEGVASTDWTGWGAWNDWPADSPNVDVRADGIRLHGFTFASPDLPDGRYAAGVVVDGINVKIYDSTFTLRGSDDARATAIQTRRDDDPGHDVNVNGLEIHDNTFEGSIGDGYMGVVIRHTLTGTGTVKVESNSFAGNVFRGVIAERGDVTIEDNELATDMAAGSIGALIRDADAREQEDIRLRDNTLEGFETGVELGTAGQTLDDVTVTGNTIADSDVGVRVVTSADEVTFTGNALSGSATWGVENASAEQLDAASNYWGDASGPDHADNPNPAPAGDAISGDVRFAAWYATDTTTSSTRNVVVTHADETLAYSDTIQGGLTAAVDGDTVIVKPGTYSEDLVIDADDLDLVGRDGLHFTTIVGEATGDLVDFPAPAPTIDVRGDGVSIHGFTLVGPDAAADEYATLLVIGGADASVFDNAFELRGEGAAQVVAVLTYRGDEAGYDNDVSGLVVRDNTFDGSPGGGYVGVWVTRDVGDGLVGVRDNVMTGTVDRGVVVERSRADVVNNILESGDNDGTGVVIADPAGAAQSNVAVVGNRLFGFDVGVDVADPGGQVVESVQIAGNRMLDGGTGVRVNDSAGGVVVTDNDLSGNDAFGAQNLGGDPLDATGNWWGDEDGPTHPTNPAGAGDAVSDGVVFDPWLGAPAHAEVDLAGELVTRRIDGTIRPGDKAKLRVHLTNLGDAMVRRRVTVNVYLSTDGLLDGEDILVGAVAKRAKLKQGKTKNWRIKLRVDQDWAPGDYRFIAVIDADDVVEEFREYNNELTDGQAYDVSWAFGTVDGEQNTKLQLTDDEGTKVKFKIFGDGDGTVRPTGDEKWNVSVFNTEAESRVKVIVRGRGATQLHNVSTYGRLDTFDAEKADLTGTMTFYGGLERLFLGDVGEGRIDVRTGGAPGGVKLYLGNLVDSTVESDVTIRQLDLESWLDAGGTNRLLAPDVKHLWCAGDFDADVGRGTAMVQLDEAQVDGAVGAGTWRLTGRTGLMEFGEAVDSRIFVGAKSNLTTLPDDADDFDSEGVVDVLRIGRLDGAKIAVADLGDAQLDEVVTDNADVQFGIAAKTIRNLLWSDDGADHSWPDNWPDDTDDFNVLELAVT